jgi:hypothetical protein
MQFPVSADISIEGRFGMATGDHGANRIDSTELLFGGSEAVLGDHGEACARLKS